MPPLTSRCLCPRPASTRPGSISAQLAELPLFSTLSAPAIARIAATARYIETAKAEFLFHKGDSCHGFYMIISGKIKLVFNALGGSEKVIEILMPGQSFGESVMFMEQPYPIGAQALTDVRCIFITKISVLEALESNPPLAQKLIATLSNSLHQLIQNQEFSGMRSGKQRIVDYILRHIRPEDTDAASPVAVLPASKATIASHLGITAEHFSRILHELIESALITVYGKRITIIDMASLRELLENSSPMVNAHPHAAPCRVIQIPLTQASRQRLYN